ncbi:hypothetical protein Tsubulata_033971 [Turnera subulata]|uniref:Uncharacterized protein n=1 Tax=Turnera subulata TaxID=218843 RepID=A0A9Q0FI92_9ROSI|nr:hypothetical protein Tsubulata_033971 [Turnera subulata]
MCRDMAGFEQQVKERAKELKVFFKKGVKIVGDSCKKGWNKLIDFDSKSMFVEIEWNRDPQFVLLFG